MKYIPTIGLEVHIGLKTNTKMFCRCPNDSGQKIPNYNVCPICLGHPGTMPSANIEAIKSVLKLGMALGGNISLVSQFDRKSYFYPDLPKGYQISQYQYPFIKGGSLSGVKIRRIHLEEDAGRILYSSNGESLCDYNRAGAPLAELVTEPDIQNGEEAVKFAKELRNVLRYLDISSADMEKGEMRLEANISVSPKNSDRLGTKVEVKNLNSFSFMAKAIDYEIQRQIEILEKGKLVLQETRGWDAQKNKTFSQRGKEEAHDYRYLPEPDLPLFDLADESFINIDEICESIPEMPWAKKERFVKEFGISDINASILVEDRQIAKYYEEVVSEIISENISKENKEKSLKLSANYVIGDIKGLLNQENIDIAVFQERVSPENIADLIILINEEKVSNRMAKDILLEMYNKSADPCDILNDLGGVQITDENVIAKAIKDVIKENTKAVDDYKKGKENALQFLFGKSMEKLKGKGSPDVIKKTLKEIATEF